MKFKHIFQVGLGIAALFIGYRIGNDILRMVGTPPRVG